MKRRNIDTDVLIIGGGTAGCFAAITLGRKSDCRVVIAEKANIERSGCLAAGVNAVNAYITEGHDPQYYVDYAKRDAEGIVREDLLLSMSERLNHVTEEMEDMGLVILKDSEGRYVSRGTRNIKINGENIKVLLAEEAKKQKNVTVLNHVNITDLKMAPVCSLEQRIWFAGGSKEAVRESKEAVRGLKEVAGGLKEPVGSKKEPDWFTGGSDCDRGDGSTGRSSAGVKETFSIFYPSAENDGGTGESCEKVTGAWGFDVNEEVFYDISAKAVLISSGGAAGLYRPNNPGFSRHKMWYPPFNTGGGYAMGLRAGAEMTTFEMRFIALRCKDTIAPTGTIAQGVGAKQVNAAGEIYETKYGVTTSERVWGTVEEMSAGRGPCYLKTEGISGEQEQELFKAYLNMAPAQTLRWMEAGKGPSGQNVEIEGTEPYVVGGHTAGGYWVDRDRRTTVPGLYAAGDVAGGCPQKYVTGALAEGEIAAETILADLAEKRDRNTGGSEGSAGKRSENSNEMVDLAEKRGRNTGGSEGSAGKRSENSNGMVNLPMESGKDPGKAAKDIEDSGETPGDWNNAGGERCLGDEPDHAAAYRNEREGETDFSFSLKKQREYERYLNNPPASYTAEELEEAMQKVMDDYAGGIRTGYRYNAAGLTLAEKKIRQLEKMTESLAAKDMDDLLQIYEVKERLLVCRALIAHLGARKETRWHSFGENADYPEKSGEWLKYVNSRLEDGEIKIIYRDLDYRGSTD